MKRISILVITITFFCAIYAAVGSGNNDVVKRYEFYARPFAVLDSTQAVTDTVAISSDSTVAMVAVDTFTTNIDSINVAVDTLTTNVDSINVTVDTLTTNVDSINVTVDTLTTNIDSINVAVDTLTTNIDSINVTVDTLTTNIDSINVAVDTLTTTVDSIEVAVDTLTTKADSVAVDSVVKKSTVPDSLLIGYMPKVNEWKYFSPTELAPAQLEALRTLYKREYEEGLDLSPPGELFNTWKLLFTSTPEKTLDLYVEGVSIIHSKIDIDTILHKRYDRMLEFRDELMELYDMAVSDIGRLNSQIDRTRSKDTLSVAKLRARQVYSYLEITAAHLAYTVDTMSKNKGKARQYILNEKKNREYAAFMYPRYKEMLKCGDLNIDMIHLYYFSILAKNRITLDKEVGLSQSERLGNFNEDKDLLLARADEIFNAPELDLYATHDRTNKPVFKAYEDFNSGISIALNQAAGLFLDNSNHEEIEKYYMERYKKGEGNDPAFWETVLGSGLRNYIKSEVYYLVLEQKYKSEYTIDLAISLVKRAISMDNLIKDNGAQHYCEEIFNMPDFYYLSVEEQVNIYMYAVVIYAEIAKKTPTHRLAKSFEYTNEVRKLCPQHPAPDYFDAVRLELMKNVFTRSNYIHSDLEGEIFYCLIDDMYSESRRKLAIFNETMQGSNILPFVKESNLKSLKEYFPKYEKAFMNGYDRGDKFTFDFRKYGKYTTTIRTRD